MQKQAYALIEEYNQKHGLKHNKATVFPHLVEEVGELAREMNHEVDNWRGEFNKDKMAKELVDVISQCLVIATDYEIDVEEIFKKKMEELRKRFELDA